MTAARHHREISRIFQRAGRRATGDGGDRPSAVIAGLDPAIPIMLARLCLPKRDGRVKPGHDEKPNAFYASSTTTLRSVPSSGLETSTTSPGLSQRGGSLRFFFTGVPATMMSAGLMVMKVVT
jgi:hypothetical protein